MLINQFKIAALLALAVGAMAVGTRTMAQREPSSPPTEKSTTDAVTVRGRVLDPDGKPIKDARLYWPRLPKSKPRGGEDIENIEIPQRAKTDAEGRFHFELPHADIHTKWQWMHICLIAAADGYGMDGVELPKNDSPPEVTLRLAKDQPIEGRILSTEGKPLPGVSVRMMGVGKTRQGRLDDFLAAWEREGARATEKLLRQVLFLPPNEKFSQAVTDKDGRFRLRGAGIERVALLRLRAPGFTPAPLFVINRAGFDAAALNKAARDRIPANERRPGRPPLLYGPKIEYVAAAGRRIEGTVREAGSGKPVPGYRISIEIPNGFDLNAVSDKEGQYKLLGVPKIKQYMLTAQPPTKSAWLPTAAHGKDAAGLRTVHVDFTVARGILVSGRVLDRATGKGVRGGVRFAPLPGNKFFGKPGYDFYKYNQYEQTMTEIHGGRFQLAVMPGLGVLMVQASGASETANGGQKLNPYKQAEFDAKDREHVKITESDDGNRSFTAAENRPESLTIQNAVKVLDLAPDADTATCDLFAERGKTRTIKIEDTDGKPLTGTTIAGVTASGWDTFTIKAATCTIFALDPKKPRRLFFLHPRRELAGTLTVRGDEKEPPVARLRKASAVMGRVLNHDGQPLTGADINSIWFDQTGFELYRVAKHQPTARTDRDGRFRIEGIVPEVKFKLGIMQERTLFLSEPRIGVKQIKPSETLDLGDIHVKAQREAPPAPKAAAPPAAAKKGKESEKTVTVRGRVLDPDGKPIKDARLYWPRLPKTPPHSEEDIEIPRRAKTDAEGRFRFELPRADIIHPEWNPESKLALIAAADGYGVDWAELPKEDAPADLTLRLVKDQPIEGRILSTEGKPLAGVRVRMMGVGKPRKDRLDDFLAAWKRDWQAAYGPQTSPPRMMLLPRDEKSSQAVTDKDGRFRVRGAGTERFVLLRLHDSAILYVINRAGFNADPVNKAVLDRIPRKLRLPGQPPLLYGPTIEYVTPANRCIEGSVRAADSGKPMAGFRVHAIIGHDNGISAVTDEDGHYKLAGIPKEKEYLLHAEPPANSSWLRAGARIKDKVGLEPIQVDFTVVRGVLVTGRVLDRATGKGVRGGIRFVPLPGNPFADKPGYDSYKYESLTNDTGTDGRFKLAVMPGPGVLMVQIGGSETINGGLRLNPYKQAEFDAKDRDRIEIIDRGDGPYFTSIENRLEFLTIQNAVKVLDFAADAGTAKCDLFLERGRKRTIKIEDVDGRPVKGTTVAGVTASWPITFTIKDATCTVFALDPKKPRRLVLLHAKRKLAGSLMLRGDEKEPPIARLRQTGSVTGRILDRDGQPIAGANIDLSSPDRTVRELYQRLRQRRQAVRTGKDGRFRIEGIVPEMKFTLSIMQGRAFLIGEPRIGARQAKSGETLDLGDIRVKPR